jgi:hypothetical protein
MIEFRMLVILFHIGPARFDVRPGPVFHLDVAVHEIDVKDIFPAGLCGNQDEKRFEGFHGIPLSFWCR